MGKEDGLAFAKRFHAVFPAVPVIMIAAFATAHLERQVARLDYLTLLHKPLEYEQLLRLLQRLTPG